jgi:hypothetical protein
MIVSRPLCVELTSWDEFAWRIGEIVMRRCLVSNWLTSSPQNLRGADVFEISEYLQHAAQSGSPRLGYLPPFLLARPVESTWTVKYESMRFIGKQPPLVSQFCQALSSTVFR